jgi:hypothetical protein
MSPKLTAFIMLSCAADMLMREEFGDGEERWQRTAPTLTACTEAYFRLSDRERDAVKQHPDWQPSKTPRTSTWFD